MRSKQLGYLGIGNRRALNVVQRPFSPSDLFATGEQGVWYDPSDLSTMFQDSAGTTPVTGVEQAVGLILDKSKGLVLGSELVTNGDFSSASGWTLAAGASISSGLLTFSSVSSTFGATQGNYSTLPANAVAKVVVVVTALTAGQFRVKLNAGAFFLVPASVGTHTVYVVAGSAVASGLELLAAGTTSGVIDNISVREIAGNHASQSTLASRPTLSARYNLLTYSEQFNDAAWQKASTTITANSVTAPDGTTTAATLSAAGTNVNALFRDYTSVLSAGAVTVSIYAKAGTKSVLQFGANVALTGTVDARANFDLANGVLGTVDSATLTASIVSVGNGWYRCIITWTRVGALSANGVWTMQDSTTAAREASSGPGDIYIWGHQLIVTNDLTSNAYQRIAAATDYDSDATKFPKYLRFDGSDDSLATSSIDFSGTNKLSIFSALRRLSDSAQGMVLELSATTASNNGTFSLETPSTASGSDFQFISKGTVANTINADDYPNPYSAIITAQSAISTPISNIRINGLEVDSDAGTQGTGNFGNFPLYVGRRNNASLPFNGRIYGLIVRGAETPEYLVKITESWLFGKSGITLDTTPDYTFVTLSNGDFVVDAYGNNVFIEVS